MIHAGVEAPAVSPTTGDSFIFEKSKFFWEWGLTNEKRVVYLCPIAPDDGDVGGSGAEKILKKMDFGFDKAEKHAIFRSYAPEALRLDEAVLKKF